MNRNRKLLRALNATAPRRPHKLYPDQGVEFIGWLLVNGRLMGAPTSYFPPTSR